MSAYAYDAVRTLFGKFNAGHAGVRPDDLAAAVLTAIRERNPDLDPAAVEEVILDNANGAGETTATSPGWRPCWPDSRSPLRGRR